MSTSSELLLERVRAATADEYTIERELGRGGMAAVFLARDIALERRVAIKVMLPDLVDVEGIADRFVIEAKTAAKLDHPGIVTVYSVKQRAGLLFIVMKFIEGRTLEQVMDRQGVLDPAVVTSLVTRVAEALQFAHAEGVVHRDVKPSNIIIDARGRPVVTDFGIAKVTTARSITVTGSMLGTPTYMSPEQCRGLPATAASDQYSLGVMLFEMLTGKVPFTGTIFELIHAHCVEPPPAIAELVPDLDPRIVATVMRMLAKAPQERWPSLTEVARELSASATHQRRSTEVDQAIVDYVRAADTPSLAARRAAQATEVSGAATELATTPAPGLVVTPVDPSIEVGATLQLRVSEASGASLAGVRITWRSEDPTIATVDEAGVVTARAVGFAKITATGGAAIGRVAVTVRPATADTVVVTPQNPALVTEAEIQLVATVLDQRGTTLVGQTIVWQSSDVSVCAVSGQGRAIAIAPGKATITAICGDVRGTANVTVRLPAVERVVIEPGDAAIEVDETKRLVATAFGAEDRKLAGRKIAWRSQAPTIVTVDAEGTITGVEAGTAAIIATCEGKDAIASIAVRNQPVVAVRIQPAQLQLEVGRSLQLKGMSEDRRGRTITGAGVEWHSDDDSIALVDASGKVHAVREGRTTVRALSGEATSVIAVTVIPRPASQVRIEAHKPTLQVGEFVALDAVVLDADGAPLTGRALAWSSDAPDVVTVNASGACEARKPGAARITATCERAKATTKLSVAAAPKVAAATPPSASPPHSAPPAAQQSAYDAATVQLGRVELPPAGGAARGAPPGAPAAPSPRPAEPVEPARRGNRWIPIGIGVAALAAVGVWAATRGGGGEGAPPTSVATTPVTGGGDSPPAGGDPGAGAGGQAGGAQTGGAPTQGGRGEQVPGAAPAVTGPTGARGPTGLAAGTGVTGAAGRTGAGAPSGMQGPTGRAGAAGPTGRAGAGGPTGLAAATGTGATTGAQGTTGQVGATGGGAPPPTGAGATTGAGGATGAAATTGAGGLAGATATTGAGGRGDPVVTPPVTVQPPPDSAARAGRGAPPAGGAASDDAEATRALLCGNAALPANLLNNALGSNPGERLNTLYDPRDAADGRAKTNLLNEVRNAQRLRTTARALRNEPAGDACDWVVALELTYTNAFGHPRSGTWHLRLRLEAAAGAARLGRVFGGVRQ